MHACVEGQQPMGVEVRLRVARMIWGQCLEADGCLMRFVSEAGR